MTWKTASVYFFQTVRLSSWKQRNNKKTSHRHIISRRNRRLFQGLVSRENLELRNGSPQRFLKAERLQKYHKCLLRAPCFSFTCEYLKTKCEPLVRMKHSLDLTISHFYGSVKIAFSGVGVHLITPCICLYTHTFFDTEIKPVRFLNITTTIELFG